MAEITTPEVLSVVENASTSSTMTASSKPDFVSSVPQKEKEVQAKDEQASLTEEKVKKVVKDSFEEAMQEKVTPEAEREAAKLLKTLMQTNLQNFQAGNFSTGNLLFYRYDAKNKENTYDKTPLTMVLRKSKGYVLGLNFHWTPVPLRITLMKVILKLNKENIKKGLPISISYDMIKPFIMKMGLGPVIRLYIFNRISRRGLVIPPTHWLIAAKLRAESFNNGISAEQAYNQAIRNYKKAKYSRGRREHTWK